MKKTSKITEENILKKMRIQCVQLLSSLLFLNTKEIQERSSQIELLPLQGLGELMIVLKMAALKQQYYFQVFTENDFLFPLKIKTILYKNRFSVPSLNHD